MGGPSRLRGAMPVFRCRRRRRRGRMVADRWLGLNPAATGSRPERTARAIGNPWRQPPAPVRRARRKDAQMPRRGPAGSRTRVRRWWWNLRPVERRAAPPPGPKACRHRSGRAVRRRARRMPARRRRAAGCGRRRGGWRSRRDGTWRARGRETRWRAFMAAAARRPWRGRKWVRRRVSEARAGGAAAKAPRPAWRWRCFRPGCG